MPGANYMGGRRNVMKARAKDTVGRQQKGHFGRQRLDILSKGISATKPSETGKAGQVVSTLNKSSALDIDLAHAHARTKINLDDTAAGYVRSFIPSPIHVTPRTPRSHNKARIRAKQQHISDPDAGRSKVLDAVDLSENLFLRRIADEILAMSNLACLPDRSSTKTTSRPRKERRVPDEKAQTPVKRKTVLEDDDLNPRRKLFVDERPHFPAHDSSNPYTPPPKKRQRLESSTSNTSSRRTRHQDRSYYSGGISSSVLQEIKCRSAVASELDSDSDSEGIHAILQTSSLWSPESRLYSSRTSYDDDIFLPDRRSESIVNVDDNQNLEDQMNLSEEASGVQAQAVSCEENPCLPSAILLESGSKWKTDSKRVAHQSVYGSLFENEDPWKTIGIILGLPEEDTGKDSLHYPKEALEFDVDRVEQLPDSLFEMLPDEELELAKEEFEDEGDEPFEWDWEVHSESPIAAVTYTRTPDDEPAVQHTFKISDLPFHDNAVNLSPVSSPQRVENSWMGVDEEEQLPEENSIAFNTPAKGVDQLTIQASLSTSISPENHRSLVPGRVEQDVMNVDDSDHGGDAGAGDKILGTPELREVNGRFLGPSLFDDSDDESEDE